MKVGKNSGKIKECEQQFFTLQDGPPPVHARGADRQVRLGGVLRLRPDAWRVRRHRDLLLVARAEEQRGVPHGREEHGDPAHVNVAAGQVYAMCTNQQMHPYF